MITPQNDRNEQGSKPRSDARGEVPGFMKSNRVEPESGKLDYLGSKGTAPPNEPEAGHHPSRGYGAASNRGDSGAGQPSSSRQPNVDANASNEDLLGAALLQVLGGNQKGGAPKVKEADSLKFPEFPRPENYRKWKAAVREEIRASSDKPDEAWEWLMEVYQDREDTRRLLQELSNPHQFVTLDTKILAKLSRVAKGDLGTQILNFKEVEAASGRVVRGRQVLFMFEQYFRTNEEAGALYGAE